MGVWVCDAGARKSVEIPRVVRGPAVNQGLVAHIHALGHVRRAVEKLFAYRRV